MSTFTADDIQPRVTRERIEGLMLFRVVLVTLFLGSALLVDVAALADFSSSRNTTIVVLIVGTYALTIFYALLLRAGAVRQELAVCQVALDVVIIGVLVDVYGGIDSPFLFLFLLTVISAALTLNRRAAMWTAGVVTMLLVLLAANNLGLFADEPAPGSVWKEAMFRVALNGAANVTVALLAGYLTERLGEATSQLEQQRASIRELRALNDNILASLSSGLLTIDRDDIVIFFNRAAAQITGLSPAEVLGKPLEDVMPEISDFISDAPSTEIRNEAEYVKEDGESVYLGFSISPLFDPTEETAGRIVIFQDLTAIKQMEHQVRRSERLAAVGRLSAAIAHEIRNPLASISGSVEMLSENEATSADDRALMGIVLREVGRLDELITEFLDYSRARELKLQPHQPGDVITKVLALFVNRDSSMQIDVDVDEDLDPIRVDEEAIRQVLWNLLNNAVDAVVDVDDPRIRLGAKRTDRGVVLYVEDNGPGIPAEDVDRVFQPFFTTKHSGTGLGLATIYRIVEDHGARCIVLPTSELGGARFEIVFSEAA